MLNYIALDLETATSERSSICQIGITFVENSRIKETKTWLIRPKNNSFSLFNTMIHGITPAMTANSPSLPNIWPELKSILDGKILVVHNAAFDAYVLRDSLIENNLEFPDVRYYCTRRLGQLVFPELHNYTLSNLCNFCRIPLEKHHSADCDSLACANLFLAEMNKAGIMDVAEIEPNLKYVAGFFAKEAFEPHYSIRDYSTKQRIDINSIIRDTPVEEVNPYIAGKRICLTGTLCNKREEVLKMIASAGGIPSNSVTKETDFLVVGVQDSRIVGDAGISSKHEKAIKLQAKGIPIKIVSEIEFFEMING